MLVDLVVGGISSISEFAWNSTINRWNLTEDGEESKKNSGVEVQRVKEVRRED